MNEGEKYQNHIQESMVYLLEVQDYYIYLFKNILYYNMKMRLILFTLSTIGTLSKIYTYWLMKCISFFISLETQTYINSFFYHYIY